MSERIPGHWFPIYRSERLRHSRPIGVRRLGEDLVLWRDESGVARAAFRGCPHRGADLALGRVIDGQLQCPYHGFRYAGDGRCTAVPCEGAGAKIPAKLRLDPRPLVEEHGLLWLWCSGHEASDDPEVHTARPWIEGLPASGRGVASRDMEWDAPLSRVVEGMLDIHHLSFAHSKYIPRKLTRLDPYDAYFDDAGILRSSGVVRPDEPDSRGWAFTMDLAPPSLLRVVFGERGQSRMSGLVACCPIDEQRTWITFRYQYALPIPWLGRLIAELSMWAELRLIQVDDHRMLATTLADAGTDRTRQLVHADKAVGLWHAWRRRAKGHESLPLMQTHHASPSVLSATP